MTFEIASGGGSVLHGLSNGLVKILWLVHAEPQSLVDNWQLLFWKLNLEHNPRTGLHVVPLYIAMQNTEKNLRLIKVLLKWEDPFLESPFYE